MARAGTEPGSVCRLTYDCGERGPSEGDLIRTVPGGCYRIDGVRKSPSIEGRVYLRVTRLGHNAVSLDAAGVWPLYWHRR